MSSNQVILEVNNLKKHFPVKGGLFPWQKKFVFAVDDVSLSLNQGETLGLVGESGCGKSTLGKAILRLHEPTSGEVRFAGEDILKLSAESMRKMRQRIQIVFQDPYSSLNPRMKVGDLVAEPLVVHNLVSKQEARKQALELLKKVGLSEDALDKYPHEFSGGQRQRICIARALSLNPELIIADEPVSALDVSVQSQILNLFKQIKDEFGLSYIFISHDLSVVKHISNKVAVMYLGKIVEYADAEDLYREPKHPYTKALISSIPLPKYGARKERIVLKGDVPSPLDPPKGCHFHPRCPMAQELCKTQAPKLKGCQANASHAVACHYVD